ncbi:hypothetical protein K501DRAFT_329594 [Backusella circina FSU 941]|nr:hypothetical protein K501DRAFT_329594 [Backusella circina FSU 941]
MNSGDSNRTTAPLHQQQQQQQHRPPPPPLSQRPIHHSTSMPFPTHNPPPPPRRINPPNPKPMTVREELAQWRQDLREESRQKANRVINARASTSSLSNLLLSRNKSSPQVQQRENHYHSPLRERHSIQRLSVPSSLSNNSNSDSSTYNRSNLFSNNNQSGLPPRRTYPNAQTNPFLPPPPPPPPPSEIQSSRSTSRVVPLPPLPPRREEESHSFNPFEEEHDIPPPAYSEIQRDTIIQVQGHNS